MTKDEQFARAKERLLDKINSWDDLYEFFDAAMDQVREGPHPQHVFSALFSMYAFLKSMRELPDEGDIKVLAERMIRIMIYEGKEKLGTEVSFGPVGTENTAAKVREIAAAIAADALAAYDVETPKTLH